MQDFTFTTPIWEHDGNASWHFVTLPEEDSDHILEVTGGAARRGFGSVRVEVSMGSSTWQTSLFPAKGRGCYILPMKKAVRTANGVGDGDEVTVTVRLVDL